MEREILFRGKRTDNGEWVTGTPFIYADRCKMIQAVAVHPDFVDEGNVYYSEGFPVDTKTVGQFTGHTDKNGKRIWEGDIARYMNKDGTPAFYEVVWDNEFFAPMLQLVGSCRGFWLPGMNELVEVIGNIRDNPELLNGTEP